MNIFLLSSWFPSPPDNGSKIRAYHLLRALAQQHDVTLTSFARDDESVDVTSAQSFCRVVAVVPRKSFRPMGLRALLGFVSSKPRSVIDTYSPEMARQAKKQLQENHFDVTVALQPGAGIYAAEYSGIKVLDEFEISVIRDGYRRAASGFGKLRYGLTWLKARNYARSVLRQFSACTVVSAQELDNLKSIAPEYQNAHIIPNGVDVESMQPGLATPRPNTMIFNGALTYGANNDAMQYFLADIWGHIKAAEPGASLQITGKSNGVDLGKLPSSEGVHLTGYLPDIRPAVAGAWACIVPLRIGGGTRLKILEAMALGTPVISTTKGAEGLEVTPEANILIADDPKEFAAQTLRLLRSPELRAQLSRNGRGLVEEKYSWRMIGDKFNQLVESVASRRSEGGA